MRKQNDTPKMRVRCQRQIRERPKKCRGQRQFPSHGSMGSAEICGAALSRVAGVGRFFCTKGGYPMRKLPKAWTGRTAVSIEAGRRALDAASTPRQIRDVAKMAELARRWAKDQGYALDQQIAWGELRFDALRKLGEILGPLLTRHRPRKGYKGFRLGDEGISRDLSSLAQRVSGVSGTVYRRYIDDAKRERREITQRDFFEKVDLVKRSQHFTGRGEAKRLYELTLRVIAEYGIKFDCWLEPAAGDGAFYDLLPVDRRLGIDIDSRHPEIIAADFLAFDDFVPGVTYAAIGNFPWGDNGVVKFFNRCADHCSVIACLVPLSFLRPQAMNQLDRRFRLLHEEVSPRGHPPVFATVFQIWIRDDELREPIETAREHPDFEFLPRDRPDLREKADIVIRRIGVDAGIILNPSEVTRADIAHWIKCRPGVDVEKVRARLQAVDWTDPKYIDAAESYGARGYRSLSMSAVIDEYERCETQALPDVTEPRYIHYDDPYHSFGGSIRICKSPQTARFIANVRVPLDFDLGAHLEAMFGPETDR
jgi:hypothetical protein